MATRKTKANPANPEAVAIEKHVTAEELRDKKGAFTNDVTADADGKTEVVTHHVKTTQKVFYLVNPGGAIHEVTEQHARQRLALGRGWRVATKEQIAEYKRRGKHQTFDDPIAPRWVPTGETLPELPEQSEG